MQSLLSTLLGTVSMLLLWLLPSSCKKNDMLGMKPGNIHPSRQDAIQRATSLRPPATASTTNWLSLVWIHSASPWWKWPVARWQRPIARWQRSVACRDHTATSWAAAACEPTRYARIVTAFVTCCFSVCEESLLTSKLQKWLSPQRRKSWGSSREWRVLVQQCWRQLV